MSKTTKNATKNETSKAPGKAPGKAPAPTQAKAPEASGKALSKAPEAPEAPARPAGPSFPSNAPTPPIPNAHAGAESFADAASKGLQGNDARRAIVEISKLRGALAALLHGFDKGFSREELEPWVVRARSLLQ